MLPDLAPRQFCSLFGPLSLFQSITWDDAVSLKSSSQHLQARFSSYRFVEPFRGAFLSAHLVVPF